MVKLFVKVKPGSFRDEIRYENEAWLIKIKAKPIDGEANKYLVSCLSNAFKINKSSINIDKGTTNQFKTLLLNISEKELNELITKYKIEK